MFKNPFLVYVLSFGLVFAVYQLGWSEIYPNLSSDLLFFFGLTFLYSILFSVLILRSVRKIGEYQSGKLPDLTVLLLLGGFGADLLYTGIPLLSVLDGSGYSGDIGVPTLHVFNVTFGGAFSAIRFSDYLYSKRRRFLWEAFLPIAFFILVLYRGPALICLVSWFFVFVIKNGLGVKRGVVIAAISLLILHLFGLAGNIREGAATAITQLGKPTAEFQESRIPATYFWTYIYLSSPMANLQLNVDRNTREVRGAFEFIVTEVIPDFLARRVQDATETSRVRPDEVSQGLTVSTMYGRSYVLAGWMGAATLFTLLSALIFVYLSLIKQSPYAVPCLALLNTLVLFCTFQNMIAFSGVILQLFWPLAFHIIVITVRRSFQRILAAHA